MPRAGAPSGPLLVLTLPESEAGCVTVIVPPSIYRWLAPLEAVVRGAPAGPVHVTVWGLSAEAFKSVMEYYGYHQQPAPRIEKPLQVWK